MLGALLIALIELVSYVRVQASVPTEGEWGEVSAAIRAGLREGDTIVSTPDWNDPTLRLFVGDLLDLGDAGRADLAPFDRVWEVAANDAPSQLLPGREPDASTRFGHLVLRRYDLGPSPVLFDFVANHRAAEVDIAGVDCPWSRRRPEGGGLWRGQLWPHERFQCAESTWTFVGETVVEDLDLQGHRCLWQHPPANNAWISSTWEDVPLGERIVLHADLYYQHERMCEGGPVELRVEVNGREVGRMIHRDCEGWKSIEIDPDPLHTGRERGDVRVSVRAADPHLRTICWAGSSRGPRREIE